MFSDLVITFKIKMQYATIKLLNWTQQFWIKSCIDDANKILRKFANDEEKVQDYSTRLAHYKEQLSLLQGNPQYNAIPDIIDCIKNKHWY